MALLGSGIVPSGAVGNELVALTRRAFIPKMIVQIYSQTPLLAAALANAQTASGGVSSVTVPVQGAPYTQAQSTDFSGSFNAPLTQQGAQNAEFNLKCVIVPIGFNAMEGILQMNAAVVPILEARMNDAGNQVADYLSDRLFTNNVANSTDIDGLPLIASTTNTYGNIDRSLAGNAFWGANVRAVSGQPTRFSVLTDIVSCQNSGNGEMPNFAVTSPGTWLSLANDFLALEQYWVTPGASFDQSTQGVRGAFTALMVGGVPMYQDPDCPDGVVYYLNTRYDSFYIHEAAAFAFTGFASTLPNLSLGYVGALVAVLEHINCKPRSLCQASGYGFQSGV